MKNIFRRSVQIFHKDKKEGDKQDYTSSGSSGSDRSPTSSLSKKDKKHSKHHQNEYGEGSPTLSRNHHDEIGHLHQQQQHVNHHIATNTHHHHHHHQLPPHQQSPHIQQQQPQQHVNLASNNHYIRHIYTNNQYDETTQINMNNGIPFIYNPNARKVFGVPLTQVPRRAGSNVPIIIEKLIDHIERTSLNSEGLFRIPGVDLTINQYIKLFDNGEDVDVAPIEPYTAAGLLKRFFRDLPVFVPQSINKRVVSLFIDEEGKKKQVDMEILGNLRVLVHQLPTVHFEVMQELTSLLGKLMNRSDQNKMTISNIAICLVPTLNCVPAIVTYSIQMHDFFYNEVFPQHHLYYMRPYEEKLVEPTQPINIMTTSGGEKRYSSRPASITISGLLPSNGQNNSPSSSTITSTTITSPHDSTAPITFTVTTTFSPEQQQQMLQQEKQQQQQQQQQQQSSLSQSQQSMQPLSDTNSTKSDRRTFRVDPNLDLTQYIEDSQYNINRNYLYNGGPTNGGGVSGTTPNGSSLSVGGGAGGSSLSVGGGAGGSNLSVSSSASVGSNTDQSKLYRRSVAYTNNEDTKAAIQQIKEKIDRYSKEKKTREEKEREKLLRYSIDLERYKDRTINKQEKRASRDINKEIEREIEKKRLSPRERLNLFGLASSSSSSVNSTLTRSTANIISTIDGSGGSNRNSKNYGGNSSSNRRYSNSINQQLQMQLQQLQIQQQQYQQTQQSQIPLQYQQQQQQQQQQTTTTTTTTSSGGSNRFSSNRYKPVDLTQSSSSFRYSREIYDDDYYSNNNLMMFGNEQPNQTPISVSSSSAFTRQRSQSCFEPENLLFLQQQYQQYQQQQQQQQQQIPFQANPQYSNAVIEQKLDQIRDTINNLHRDNRVSRDYTHYLREVEDLRSSLQKETVVSNEYIKNIELEDKLRREEEKNQRLIEEIHLLETYFILKEKSKAKRLSTTKDLLTRSRSPTLPTSMNMSTSSLGSSSSSAYNNNVPK